MWFSRSDAPQFGKIYDILIFDKEAAVLCVHLYLTDGIDYHYHSYVIKETDNDEVICVNDKNKLICLLHPLQSHSLQSMPSTLFIVAKHFIFKT